MRTSYDTIGVNYSDLRKPDVRIETAIVDGLGPARTILNVGAGSGSYEPVDRAVVAVEPSMEMIRQRKVSAAPVVQAYAEKLPFADNSFDASMAILTVHHWANKEQGLAEMRRVTRGPIVILTFDTAHQQFWLADYLPELVKVDEGQMPAMTDYEKWLGPVAIAPVRVPHDCSDGFLGAYWRRPAAYLDPKIRAAISCFWAIDNVDEKLKKLGADLDSGAWAKRHSALLDRDEHDLGYRLVVAQGSEV